MSPFEGLGTNIRHIKILTNRVLKKVYCYFIHLFNLNERTGSKCTIMNQAIWIGVAINYYVSCTRPFRSSEFFFYETSTNTAVTGVLLRFPYGYQNIFKGDKVMCIAIVVKFLNILQVRRPLHNIILFISDICVKEGRPRTRLRYTQRKSRGRWCNNQWQQPDWSQTLREKPT